MKCWNGNVSFYYNRNIFEDGNASRNGGEEASVERDALYK